MKQNKRKINIVFDFDNTLISARKVYKHFEHLFERNGIKKTDFQEVYRESKAEGIFNLKRLIFLLNKNFSLPKKKIKNALNLLFKKCKSFLYPDVFSFIKKWSKKADLFLVTLGDKKFQQGKIKGAKLDKYFKKIFITQDESKLKEFKQITKKTGITFIIDDSPKTLSLVKNKIKKVVTVRINRGEGKYKNFPDDKNIDFSIKKLKELDEILQKVKEKPKAIVLFSGGLDSILAAEILRRQGVHIKAVIFKGYFWSTEKAEKIAKELKIPFKVVDISRSHLKIVKNPHYGYGKSMNPCLDCRILILKKAKEIMKREKFDFVATGEVLGERPMTQNKKALFLTEKKSGLKGYLLRPLSAKLLPKTIPEKLFLIEREKLLDIKGRARKRQIRLAEKFGIKNYPSPAGGCLLTDIEFGKRLKELLKIFPGCQRNDIELLKLGRHFWEKKVKIVVGRNEEENKKIKKLARKRDILIEMENYPGPTTLIRNYGENEISKDVVKKAKKLTRYYSTKARAKKDIKFLLKSFS